MTSEKVSDFQLVNLLDYFSPDRFRLIPAENLQDTGGITELRVVVNIHSDLLKKLEFNNNSLLSLYGFARMNETLVELNKGWYTTKTAKHLIEYVELNDCGELFTMIFVLTDGRKIFYSVNADDVLFLLNSCRRPAGDFMESKK